MSKSTTYRERILRGPIIRTMLWLAWPVMIANLVQMSYNLVDALWLGRLGRQSFAAPTVSWPLIMLFNSIGFGLAQAGMTLISQYFGAGDRKMSEKCACQLIAFIITVATIMSIIGFLIVDKILLFMGVPSDVYKLALNYTRTIFAGLPIAFTGFAFIMIANAIGDTRTPTKLSITSALVNMVLDPILIFGLLGFPRLEVVGAALATILSRALIATIGLTMLFRGFYDIKISLQCMRIEKWWLRKVVSIGLPLTIQSSSNALGFTVLMSIVSRFGSVAIAAYGIGIRIIDIIQAFTWGLQRAISIMIGQNIGAENYHRAKKIAYLASAFIALVLTFGAMAIYTIRTQAVAVFVPDPLVIAEGSIFLGYFIWSLPYFGVFFISNGVAQGSGHTKIVTLISIARLWFFRVGFSLLLAIYLGMGTTGIWIAMTLSNMLAGIMAMIWMSRGRWLKRVIEQVTITETSAV